MLGCLGVCRGFCLWVRVCLWLTTTLVGAIVGGVFGAVPSRERRGEVVHFMAAVRAEAPSALELERERRAQEFELEARFIARRVSQDLAQLREAANLERWYYAACGFSS